MNTAQYTIWEETPLKWHKFLTYFSLPLAILLNAAKTISALATIGQLQGSGLEWLAIIDLVFSAALVALSIAAIVGGLPKNRRWYGPLCYLGGLGANILYSVVVVLIYISFYIEPTVNLFTQMITFAVLLALNIVYYNKRRQLFA